MISHLAYYTAEVVAVTCFAMVGLCFLLSRPNNVNIRLFALICLSNLSYLITRMGMKSTPEFEIELGVFWYPLHVVMNTGAGFWMILCYSLFQETHKLPAWLLFCFILQVGLSAVKPAFVPLITSEIDVQRIGEASYFIFGSLPLLMQSAFAAAAIFWIAKGWRDDLVASRRLLRAVTLVVISTMYIGVTLAEIFLMTASAEIRIVGNNFITLFTVAVNIAFVLLFLRIDPVALRRFSSSDLTESGISVVAEEDNKGVEGRDEELANFLLVFRDQRSYLEPGLSIANLAGKLKLPQYRLRSLINQTLGYRNFNALLNEYRINDACGQLADHEKNHLPILTIALTVGYQSIAPFNKAFRELKGVTPSTFRKQAGGTGATAVKGVTVNSAAAGNESS